MMRRGKLAENFEDWKIGSMPKSMSQAVFPLCSSTRSGHRKLENLRPKKIPGLSFVNISKQMHKFAHFKQYYNFNMMKGCALR